MTSKKKRQRGSRTHGGGSHKNRRGAGHRGGRGRAGRDKHEYHNYEPLGKHGFTPPENIQDDVVEVSIQKLDEDAPLLAAEGLAEEVDGGYRIDARDVAEDGYAADAVKVLGNGQVRGELHVTADAFSASARGQIEEAGGTATLSERAEATEGKSEAVRGSAAVEDRHSHTMRRNTQPNGGTGDGDSDPEANASEEGDSEPETDTAPPYEDELTPSDVVRLYEEWTEADEERRHEIDNRLDDYFADLLADNRDETLQKYVEEPTTPEEVAVELRAFEDEWRANVDTEKDRDDGGLVAHKREYLLSVREAVKKSV